MTILFFLPIGTHSATHSSRSFLFPQEDFYVLTTKVRLKMYLCMMYQCIMYVGIES